jgi:single-strand DNA-binding protein
MLIGNLGKDPDVQFLEGNIGVAKFPLATTETFKDRSGKLVSQTEWHTVVLWRGLADWHRSIFTKVALFILKAGYEPAVGKTKKVTGSLQLK